MIVLMGVSGCGKTTVGKTLSQVTSIPFYDGDDFHPQSNKDKMASGVPLDDTDRQPWLQSIVDFATEKCDSGQPVLVACSALKKKYRDQLRQLNHPVIFIHLFASIEIISARQANRPGHFMPASLMESQYAALETPTGEPGVIEISVDACDPLFADYPELLDESSHESRMAAWDKLVDLVVANVLKQLD
jgi:gluconokinase